jgi:predicted amidohydrolase YtcJ
LGGINRQHFVRATIKESLDLDQQGTISKGKLADLAVLSQDIFTIPVPELPKTNCVLAAAARLFTMHTFFR